ncbi:MAG TPA: sugar phosphate isomerase/epimerase [Isosphaeraceae bacterium]|nr:sugar phosphate isomerase/epimerase [Isosphaeraceae bacterium]
MRSDNTRNWSRREVLAAGLTAAGALALGGRASLAAPPPDTGNQERFKLGLQSYSLRGYTKGGKPNLDKALAVTKDLGLKYWEAYPAHVPTVSSPAEARKFIKQAADYGVTIIGYGVVGLGKDHDANKRCFDFAKAMDLGYLSADPDPDSFDGLDRLVEEYGIGVGIHNHGPGHRYGTIDAIADAIKDRNPKIGCCVDTGHFLRSREDPVRAIEVFGDRVFGVHLKDVKDAKTFTTLGKGDLRIADFLKALAKIPYNYGLMIEYEENPQDPSDDIRACLDAYREALAG